MKELTLEITNKCQLECPWCSSVSNPQGIDVNEDVLHEKIIEHRNEVDVIRLSGGEPTLHTALPRLIDRARDVRKKIILMTNGQKKFFHPHIDHYIVQIVNPQSGRTAVTLKFKGYLVSTHVVATKGNEDNLIRAITMMKEENIPLRILKLQFQGRGTQCDAMNLLSWTGDNGCNKENKITLTANQKEVSCSAFKHSSCHFSRKLRGKE